jgi:hypothetical protein
MLAGFDPTRAFSVSAPLVAVAEPGSRATVAACLGGSGPTSTVTVTPRVRRGQVTVTPSTVSFTTANWSLPQLLNVFAVNDAVSEGTHRDTVRFSLANPNPYYNGNSATEIEAVITDDEPLADLSLAWVGGETAATVNSNFEALFRVTNVGPIATSGSVVQITPLAGASFVRVNGAAACTAGAGVLTCTIGPLAPGATADFTLVFTATAAGAATNTATLTSTEPDGNLTNNTVVWTVNIS